MTTSIPVESLPSVKPLARVTARDRVATQSAATPGNATSPAPDETVRKVDPRELEAAVSALNEHAQQLQRALQFSVDDQSGRTVIKVVDRETKEVIRQIPSEETLQIAARLRAATAGLLVSDKA